MDHARLGELGRRDLAKKDGAFVQRPRVEPGHFRDHHSLSSGNAIVIPKLTVVCAVIGAYCR